MTKFNWLVVAITTLISGWLGNSISEVAFGWNADNLSSASVMMTAVFAASGFLISLVLYLDRFEESTND